MNPTLAVTSGWVPPSRGCTAAASLAWRTHHFFRSYIQSPHSNRSWRIHLKTTSFHGLSSEGDCYQIFTVEHLQVESSQTDELLLLNWVLLTWAEGPQFCNCLPLWPQQSAAAATHKASSQIYLATQLSWMNWNGKWVVRERSDTGEQGLALTAHYYHTGHNGIQLLWGQ